MTKIAEVFLVAYEMSEVLKKQRCPACRFLFGDKENDDDQECSCDDVRRVLAKFDKINKVKEKSHDGQ